MGSMPTRYLGTSFYLDHPSHFLKGLKQAKYHVFVRVNLAAQLGYAQRCFAFTEVFQQLCRPGLQPGCDNFFQAFDLTLFDMYNVVIKISLTWPFRFSQDFSRRIYTNEKPADDCFNPSRGDRSGDSVRQRSRDATEHYFYFRGRPGVL